MSNIRGIGDIRNNNRPNRGGGPGAPGGGGDASGLYSLLGINRNDSQDPRKESFFDMLHNSFCPTLRFMSHTTVISIVNVGLFIVSLIVSGIYREGEFLQVNQGYFLDNFAQNAYKIRVQHQYWRLLTACFLHLSFGHIVMNTFSLLIWGSFIETFTGTTRYMAIYFFAGITGNLMSATINTDNINSVGASGCIMGITATLIGMLILNWMAMSEGQFSQYRGTLTCMVFMIVIFTLMFTLTPQPKQAGGSKTDNWAHLGGFLGGLFLAMAIGRVYGRGDGPFEKKVRIIGWVLCSGLVLATLIPLLTAKQ